MARLSLTCECGWSFFVSDFTDQATVKCPNCGEPVPVPGFIEGETRLTPGEIASRKMRLQETLKNTFVVAALLGGLALGIMIFQKNEEEPAKAPPVSPPPTPVSVAPTPPQPPAPVPAAPAPPLPPEPKPADDALDEADFEFMRSRAASLRNKAMLVPRMDVVHLKGKSPIEGTVRDDKSDPVLLETPAGPLRVPRDQIDRIERGEGKAAQYLVLYQEAAGDPDLLARLMQWCMEHRLDVHREYLCYKILLLDPENPVAHAEYMRLRRREGTKPKKE